MTTEWTPLTVLKKLVSFPSVVGRPNGAIAEWVRAYAEACGAVVAVVPGPEGDRVNLLVTVGPSDQPGYVLSGHMDVVPASEPEWTSDPFALRREGDRLYGRGTSDMKGFNACALAMLPTLAAKDLARPIHIALSYDEEAGCRGVPHLIAALPNLCAPPQGVVVGEPSGLVPILAHKGKAAARAIVRGRAGHSSRPDLGLNAIHAMVPVLDAAVKAAEELKAGPFDVNYQPAYSSLQVGLVGGGEAINVVPERCAIDIEARAIFGVSPAELLAPVAAELTALQAQGFETEWEPLSTYPALRLDAASPLAAVMTELTGKAPIAAVSYGTEAGLFQAAGYDAIICGPGDISRAHRPDEYLTLTELHDCCELIKALGARLSK